VVIILKVKKDFSKKYFITKEIVKSKMKMHE